MNAPPANVSTGPDFRHRALLDFKKEQGLSFVCWALVALLHFLAQIIFRRELSPGEFGALNTALGAVGLMTVPILAVHMAFVNYLALPQSTSSEARLDSLRAASLAVTETFAWAWGAASLPLISLLLPLLDFPRFSLQLFTLMNVLVAVGGAVSWVVCRESRQLRLWAWLAGAAALGRVLLALGLTAQSPWAEAALAAVLISGFALLSPALRHSGTEFLTRLKACQSVLDRPFLVYLGATFSVLLALYLFSSTDRLVAQSEFGAATNNNMGLVNWSLFDAYQTAGLLARGLLWGTQPLLWIFFVQRSRLDRTTAGSLAFFWIYLGALFAGAFVLGLFAQPLSHLFCGYHFDETAHLVPSLTAAMVPLGLLQALGIFSLASRRFPECFVIGGCALVYAVVLYFAGREPQLMPAYMFGAALVALMVVLFVGVVRWGRKQP